MPLPAANTLPAPLPCYGPTERLPLLPMPINLSPFGPAEPLFMPSAPLPPHLGTHIPQLPALIPVCASATPAIHFRIGFYSLVWQVCPMLHHCNVTLTKPPTCTIPPSSTANHTLHFSPSPPRIPPPSHTPLFQHSHLTPTGSLAPT